MRFHALLIVTLMSLSLAQALPPPGAGPEGSSHAVWGATPGQVAARGGDVVDDYGTYVHATLTAREVLSLREAGFAVEPLPAAVSRGRHLTTDEVPPALRAPPTTQHFVVQFRGPVKAGWLDALHASGARALEYLPSDAFLVRAGPAGAAGLALLPAVARVTPYHPALKLSPLLHAEGEAPVTAFADREAVLPLVLHEMRLLGVAPTAAVTTASRHVIDLRATPAQAEAVARLEDVLWIEPAFDTGGPDLNKSSSLTQSGIEGSFLLHDKGVDGSTQKVVVCDNGLDTRVDEAYAPRTVMWARHSVFNDSDASDPLVGLLEFNAHLANPPLALPEHRKILLYYAPVENGQLHGNHEAPPNSAGGVRNHGTRTASIVAGDAPTWGARDQHDGVAFDARLFICDAEIDNQMQFPNDAWNYLWPAYDRGARVASFSFGADPMTTAYTDPARQMDEIAWAHRDLVIARAIGNTGTQTPRPETMAKSVLAVGGTEGQACSQNTCQSSGDEEKVHVLSSKGPAADGRFKPNVVAPGFCVRSAMIGGYGCDSGTSYATPAVAAAAALVRDYFAKGYHPTGAAVQANEDTTVSSALVRAMIMASGRDLANVTNPAFPNGEQGWGRVLLDNVLHFQGETRKLLVMDESDLPSLTTGGTWSRHFRVNGGGEVRVFLAWTDYPGTVGAAKALVNDLDLRVGGPGCGGGILDPVCIGNAFGVGSNETAGGKEHPADRINAEEAVYLCKYVAATDSCDVPTGTYKVTVNGFNVPTAGGQPFALVVTGDVEWV